MRAQKLLVKCHIDVGSWQDSEPRALLSITVDELTLGRWGIALALSSFLRQSETSNMQMQAPLGVIKAGYLTSPTAGKQHK